MINKMSKVILFTLVLSLLSLMATGVPMTRSAPVDKCSNQVLIEKPNIAKNAYDFFCASLRLKDVLIDLIKVSV